MNIKNINAPVPNKANPRRVISSPIESIRLMVHVFSGLPLSRFRDIKNRLGLQRPEHTNSFSKNFMNSFYSSVIYSLITLIYSVISFANSGSNLLLFDIFSAFSAHSNKLLCEISSSLIHIIGLYSISPSFLFDGGGGFPLYFYFILAL